MNKRTIHVGDVYPTKCGVSVEVLAWFSKTQILVRFMDEYKLEKWVASKEIKNGMIKNFYAPIIFGKGFLGNGPYSGGIAYKKWYAMLSRCYDTRVKTKDSCYELACVSPDWHNFQNFACWFYKQKGSENKSWHLDKDLLGQNSKLYSEDTCCILPAAINSILHSVSNFSSVKGYSKIDNGFSVKVFGKYCGFYSTEEQAKAVHTCLFKQKFQDLIDKYASLLENKAINALESIMEEIK